MQVTIVTATKKTLHLTTITNYERVGFKNTIIDLSKLCTKPRSLKHKLSVDLIMEFSYLMNAYFTNDTYFMLFMSLEHVITKS